MTHGCLEDGRQMSRSNIMMEYLDTRFGLSKNNPSKCSNISISSHKFPTVSSHRRHRVHVSHVCCYQVPVDPQTLLSGALAASSDG